MQIVIKMSKENYESIKYNTNKTGSDYLILNGKILPAGHGRLIDADVLVDGMEDDYEFCEAVNATPTIIEADGGTE